MTMKIHVYLKRFWYMLPLGLIIIFFNTGCGSKEKPKNSQTDMITTDTTGLTTSLPAPHTTGSMSLEEALSVRRSHRAYTDEAISSEELSQILWAAYGITKPVNGARLGGGLRTAPSAGATYPLNVYVLVGKVTGITTGFYRYLPDGHKIIKITEKDLRADLYAAAYNQEMIKVAPACLFYSATFSRTTDKYGNRGRERYVYMDQGHSAENVYLEAEALHLGTCAIGAFDDPAVKKAMMLSDQEVPMYIMPLGKYLHD
jgi:SagB-type dehydrogenase family enzyme